MSKLTAASNAGNDRVNEIEINRIFTSLVETDISLLYFGKQMRLRRGIDKWITITILISSLSCVASWVVVSKHPLIWQSLTVLVAAISIIQVVLDFAGAANRMENLWDNIFELNQSYEELYHDLADSPRSVALERYNALKRRGTPIGQESARMHDWKWLLNKCFTEACIARGVESPLETKRK